MQSAILKIGQVSFAVDNVYDIVAYCLFLSRSFCNSTVVTSLFAPSIALMLMLVAALVTLLALAMLAMLTVISVSVAVAVVTVVIVTVTVAITMALVIALAIFVAVSSTAVFLVVGLGAGFFGWRGWRRLRLEAREFGHSRFPSLIHG